LQNYKLGPPLQTYGPNIKVTVILCVVGLLLFLLIFAVAIEVKDLTAWTIVYLAAALYGGVGRGGAGNRFELFEFLHGLSHVAEAIVH
jgi:hypothetical protein